MVDVFDWNSTVDGYGGETALRTRKAQFGDGYAQRVADGLNNRASTYTLRFANDGPVIAAILAFLDSHGGATAFYWTPPLRQPALFVCEKYTDPTKDGDVYAMTAQFEETFSL